MAFERSRKIIALVLILLGTSCLEDIQAVGQTIGLHDAIRKLAAAREEIKSYELSIYAAVVDEANPEKLTNGETFVPEERLVSFTLDYAVDAATNRFLVARHDHWENVTTRIRRSQNWHVYLTSPEATLVGREGQIGKVDPKNAYRPLHFDPLGLGLAFPGEYNNGHSWRHSVKNYLKWRATELKMQDDDALSYDNGSVHIIFDAKRDYWPIKLQYGDRDQAFKTELKLAFISGRWLPETGLMKKKGMEQRLKFEWKSVNSPVSKRFEMEDIGRRYDVNVTKP